MEHHLLILLVTITCLLLIPNSEQIQSSHTKLLQQLRRQLEYPKQLETWDNTENLCTTKSSSALSVICQGNFVTELKIVGDKLPKPSKFVGYSIANYSLSESFSADSFVTTLSRLTTLRVVILVSLGIWGPIPDKIHRLYSLEVLDLSSNFLYGSIPPKISAMTKLQTIRLDGNYLNDTVPNWFSSLSNLTVLRLQSNRLKGSLPPSISKISTLTEFALSDNNISGKVPNLSNLNSLEMLDLRDNVLDSELPALPKGVVTVLLSKNSFTGEIPQQFTELARLQHLDLSFNLLVGTPPEGLFSLPNISYLNMASNMLTGSLPKSMICSSQLGYVDLSTNRFIGDLPDCLTLNSNKRVVKFSGNCLSIDPQHQHEAKYCQESRRTRGESESKGVGVLGAVIGGIAFLVLSLLLVSLILCRRGCQKAISEQHLLLKQMPDNSATGLSSELLANARYISQAAKMGKQILPTYRMFSVEELKEATKNFEHSAYIGEGSVGKLYKGRLENGSFVAIRCLQLFKRYSIRNLKLRLDLLAKLRHPNLVCLLGHCIDSSIDDSNVSRVFLVYEYVPEGNLRAYLSDSNPERALKWPDRLQVLIGIAKAVHFLHTGIIPGSSNNRLKTNSILFDEHSIAKLSDYGLSIITEEIYRNEARVEGQKSIQDKYSIPEIINSEDDVYSFGCILLEVLTGPSYFEKGEACIVNELTTPICSQEERNRVLDSVVVGTSSQESLSVVISITTKCLLPDSSIRPSIEEVLWNLQYAAQIQQTTDGDQRSEVSSQ
ncbi:putative inactive leucine-rich repeat receptor-like protein kinase, partial [Ananas comosus]